ncbi:hypothetical protein B0H13DRAFT_1861460 [Mycena leptocephala]|nr:hypothetical protein B0H13DRAFT_1861460 [Mycena leptocephala]
MYGHERWASTLSVEFWAWFLNWLSGFLCPHAATRPKYETGAQALPSDTIPDTRDQRRNKEEGDGPPRTREGGDGPPHRPARARHAPRAGNRHAKLFSTFGVLLRVSGVEDQAIIAPQILFPSTPIVTGHHESLPTYAEIFGYTLVPSPSTDRVLREKGRGVDEGGSVYGGDVFGFNFFCWFIAVDGDGDGDAVADLDLDASASVPALHTSRAVPRF